jgi:hypothetical protein
MLNKKNDKTKIKCPFRGLKPCDGSCGLYREGIRYKEGSNEAFPFADCAINIIADNLEAMHNRTFMMQREVGETKNVMSLKILADLGLAKQEQVVEKAMKIINPSEVKMLE